MSKNQSAKEFAAKMRALARCTRDEYKWMEEGVTFTCVVVTCVMKKIYDVKGRTTTLGDRSAVLSTLWLTKYIVTREHNTNV